MNPHDRFEGVGESASDDSEYDDIPGGTRYIPAIAAPLSREDFDYYWSEELVILFHTLIDHARQYGWPLFENLSITQFCTLAFETSSRSKPAA